MEVWIGGVGVEMFEVGGGEGEDRLHEVRIGHGILEVG